MSPLKHRATHSREGPADPKVDPDNFREPKGALEEERQSPRIQARSMPQFSLRSLLLGVTFFALFCGLILSFPIYISQILIGTVWIASAGWLITGICFAQGDQRAFCIGASIVIASMWTGVGARFVEGMTSLLASILGGWTSSGPIARWIELVLLLLAAFANGRLAVRARHYFERAAEPW